MGNSKYNTEEQYGDENILVIVSDTNNLVLLIKDDILKDDFSSLPKYRSFFEYSRIFNIANLGCLTNKSKHRLVNMVLNFAHNNLDTLIRRNNIYFDLVDRENDVVNKVLENDFSHDDDSILAAVLSSTIIRPNISYENLMSVMDTPLVGGDLHNFRNYSSGFVTTGTDITITRFNDEDEFEKFNKFCDLILDGEKVLSSNLEFLFNKMKNFSNFISIFEKNNGFELSGNKALQLANIINFYDAPEMKSIYSERVDATDKKTHFPTVSSYLTDVEYESAKEIVDAAQNVIETKGTSDYWKYRVNPQELVSLFAYFIVKGLQKDALDVVHDVVSNCLNGNDLKLNAVIHNKELRSMIDYHINHYDGTPFDFYLDIEGITWELDKSW